MKGILRDIWILKYFTGCLTKIVHHETPLRTNHSNLYTRLPMRGLFKWFLPIISLSTDQYNWFNLIHFYQGKKKWQKANNERWPVAAEICEREAESRSASAH